MLHLRLLTLHQVSLFPCSSPRWPSLCPGCVSSARKAFPQPLFHPVNSPADSFGPECVRSEFFSSPCPRLGGVPFVCKWGVGRRREQSRWMESGDRHPSIPLSSSHPCQETMGRMRWAGSPPHLTPSTSPGCIKCSLNTSDQCLIRKRLTKGGRLRGTGAPN